MTVSTELRDELIQAIPSLRAFARSLAGTAHAADDLVQETLTKAWNKFDSFEEGTNLKAWLFTILRNEFYSQIRKRKREVEDADGVFEGSLSEHPPQQGHMDMKDFSVALEQLPEDQREALVLVGASGFAYEEAARIIGCATGTVKSRVSRARSQLAQILQLEGGDNFGPDKIAAPIVNKPAA